MILSRKFRSVVGKKKKKKWDFEKNLLGSKSLEQLANHEHKLI